MLDTILRSTDPIFPLYYDQRGFNDTHAPTLSLLNVLFIAARNTIIALFNRNIFKYERRQNV